MTWGFLARIWSKKLTKNKYVTSPTPQIPPQLNPHISPYSSLLSSSLPLIPLPHFFPTPPPCFPLYPIPKNLPLSYPNPLKISLPTLILHTQITHFPPITSPHHIILPIFPSKSYPHSSPNHPKYVKTIPHSPHTMKIILDFDPNFVYNIRISTSKMLKF